MSFRTIAATYPCYYSSALLNTLPLHKRVVAACQDIHRNIQQEDFGSGLEVSFAKWFRDLFGKEIFKFKTQYSIIY